MSFNMTAGDPARHVQPIAQMVSNQYAGGEYVDEISRKYLSECHYDWATTRLIWEGERLVHHWGVWGHPVRVGPVTLQAAGIGAVVTVEDRRKQGLMHQAARASFDAMRENGYDVSILRGRHYAKFGYVRAWNYVTYRLKPDEIPSFEVQRPYEPLGPDRMDAINTSYNKHYAAFSGSVVRPSFPMLEAADEMDAYGWFDNDGNLAGYVRAIPREDGATLQCLEATGDPQQGLGVLAALFGTGSYETLSFFTMPHQHPMLQILRRGACTIEDRYFYHSGWQVRLVNLSSALQKLRPTLEARLQASTFADWQGTLCLDAGSESAVLEIDDGQVQIAAGNRGTLTLNGGPAIARFLIGSDEPEEIMQQAEITCSEQTAVLVSALFPNLYPMMSHWDEY